MMSWVRTASQTITRVARVQKYCLSEIRERAARKRHDGENRLVVVAPVAIILSRPINPSTSSGRVFGATVYVELESDTQVLKGFGN